jgi:pyruvate dehydrogenase E2 component (dihydrolipoamide acetyltransferase)
MSRLRRTIAANMSKSWAEIPHVTTFDDVDATRLLEVRIALSERHEVKIPIEALLVRAVLPALSAFPEFNATVDGDDLLVHGSHDIGIAVDTPDGLLVAVIRDADTKGVLELATEVARLGEGARERTLSPDELTGQTFTVSNIGAVGGGHGTPIVPPGTTAILSIGRAKSKPIVYDGDLVIAPVMPLSLSYDHRVIDGGMGRRFMAMLMENLEEPALFLAG